MAVPLAEVSPVVFTLEPNAQVPLYQQIREGLRAQIEAGALPPGQRLPSSRQLARDLGVSRITAASAYAELEAEGLVEPRSGSGTYVAEPWAPAPPRPPEPAEARLPGWQAAIRVERSAERERMMRESVRSHGGNLIAFAWARGDVTLFPTGELRRAIADAIENDAPASLQYSPSEGHRPLRSWIAGHLRLAGVELDDEDVIVTAGAQQAIDLLARIFVRAGDRVVVEGPTYPGALEAFESAGAELVEVPLDGEGMRADALAAALERGRPRLVYTIPTFHNPTGAVMSAARRREVVALAERHGVPLVEDDYLREVRFGSPIPPPLAAFDAAGNVILIGSFSKSLLPSLRLGYVVARGPLREQLIALKRVSDVGCSALLQRALHRCLESGAMHAYWKRASRLYRRRQQVMTQALRRHFPAGTRWSAAQGGLMLWVRVPGGASVDALLDGALAAGVSFAAGSAFFARPADQPFMRLSFAAQPEREIERGIAILGRLLSDQLARPATRSA